MERKMKNTGIEWIGKIPEDWKIVILKHKILSSNSGEHIDKSWWNEGEELLYTCQRTPMKSFYNKFPNYKRTKKEDLLLAKDATPYVFVPIENSIYGNHVQRVSINLSNSDIRFLAYILQQTVDAYGTAPGVSIPSYNMDIWKNLKITQPPKEEQIKIADFLDNKCERIDGLISDIKNQIDILKQYKKSLITEAVTKGLNPNAEMKDSGVEWIGKIPENWKISKNKYLIYAMYSGGTPTSSNPDYYSEDGIPFVTIRDMSNVDYVENTKMGITKSGVKNKNLKLQSEGTILYSIYATIGSVSELKINATISQAILAITLNNKINRAFYKYNLIAMRDYIHSVSNVNTQFNLNAEKVRNFDFTLPDLDEQQQIANYLDDKCSAIDSLISDMGKQIDTLKQYKKSLIYEYVTGKKAVEEAAANE